MTTAFRNPSPKQQPSVRRKQKTRAGTVSTETLRFPAARIIGQHIRMQLRCLLLQARSAPWLPRLWLTDRHQKPEWNMAKLSDGLQLRQRGSRTRTLRMDENNQRRTSGIVHKLRIGRPDTDRSVLNRRTIGIAPQRSDAAADGQQPDDNRNSGED